jgi:hypothetical protein
MTMFYSVFPISFFSRGRVHNISFYINAAVERIKLQQCPKKDMNGTALKEKKKDKKGLLLTFCLYAVAYRQRKTIGYDAKVV